MKTNLLVLFAVSSMWMHGQTTPIPDPNFEQALITLGYDTNGLNGNILNSDAELATTLYVNNSNISSLEGVEAFINVTDLRFSDNSVTTVDLSSNAALNILVSQNNPLVALDLSQNFNLTLLFSDNTDIATITFSNPSALVSLNLANAPASFLDLSNMPNLESIDITNSNVSNVNVSSNPQLDALYMAGTNSSNLDLSQNPDLQVLSLYDNNFSAIDFSNNPAITTLYLGLNRFTTFSTSDLPNLVEFAIQNQQPGFKLTSIDVSGSPVLTTLYVEENELTSIDLSANAQLDLLNIGLNTFTALDVTNNSVLRILNAYVNNLETVDLSGNPALTVVNVSDNDLIALNLANGNNAAINTFFSGNNPSLSCIQVDDLQVAYNKQASELWFKDDVVLYETDCNNPGVLTISVPDDNLEQALIDYGIDRSGILDDTITLSEALNTTFLDLNGRGINDATGLQSFKHLTGLNIAVNNLSSMDVSAMSRLVYLDVYDNNLSSLNVDNNPEVSELYLGLNNISSIDVSQLNLRDFFIHENPIASVDLANSTNLERFYAYDCELVSVDVSNSPNLEVLSLDRNNLSDLNLANGNNAILNEFFVFDNSNLFCLQVDNVEQAYLKRADGVWGKNDQALYQTDCANPTTDLTFVPDDNFEQALIDFGIDRSGVMDNYITKSEALNVGFMDLSNRGIFDPNGLQAFKYLTGLNLANNNLSTINISTLTALDYIDVYNNNLNSLDISNNPNLQRLFIAENNLTSIDVGALNLIELSMDNNNIASLDLSNSTDLERFYAYNNNLNAIDFSNNPNLEVVMLNENANIGTINLSSQTELIEFSAGGTGISTIDVSANPNLTDLNLYSNAFATIDVSNNLNLVRLDLNNNDVTGLVDLSNHPTLEIVLFEGNNLLELDLKNGNTNAIIEYDTRNNPSLNCVQVDDVAFANANFLQRDGFTGFNTDCNFTLSIEDVSLENTFSLYPNPVQSELQISTTETIEALVIVDMTGKVIRKVSGDVKTIDVSDLSTGMYIVKIQTNANSFSQKVIKN